MRSRADEIRKRIEKRKKDQERINKQLQHRLPWAEEEEKHGFGKMPSYEGTSPEGEHPLFKKEVFFFKLLASACLVLVTAILFKNPSAAFEPAKNFVAKTMETDFQFAAVSEWYEEQFGEPLALVPFTDSKKERDESAPAQEYALPASGKILEEFDETGQRVTIEIAIDANVESVEEGLVKFASNKEGFGKTVIVQHADKTETWYGNLSEIKVNLYDYIGKGVAVGTAAEVPESGKGSFYFALKQGDDFIDPIQVMQFD